MKNCKKKQLITYVILIFIAVVVFCISKVAYAISGACSSHNGVDCSRGWQSDGRVYCNDGWADSIVYYDYMEKCKSDADDLIYKQYYYDGKIVETEYCPLHSQKKYQYSESKYLSDGSLQVPFYCVCDIGYYNYKTENDEELGHVCEKGEPYVYSLTTLQLASAELDDAIKNTERSDALCKLRYGNSILKNDKCICASGYRWMYDAYTKNIYCIKRDDYNEISDEEIDTKLAEQLKGQILLQVESHGEAYYVNPNDSKKYYLGRPTDAFNAMRKLGLGATHEFITSQTIYPAHVLGKILLDVEDSGKAYYIYPKDKKAYYLSRPADAFQVMRNLGLGITNSDLSKIPEGSL